MGWNDEGCFGPKKWNDRVDRLERSSRMEQGSQGALWAAKGGMSEVEQAERCNGTKKRIRRVAQGRGGRIATAPVASSGAEYPVALKDGSKGRI